MAFADDLSRGHLQCVYEECFGGMDLELTLEGSRSKVETSTMKATLRADEICTAEDAEIDAIRAELEADRSHIDEVLCALTQQHVYAAQLDQEDFRMLQSQWGLTVRSQIPVPGSKLPIVLDHAMISRELLVNPRELMYDVERRISLSTGAISAHANLLATVAPVVPVLPHHLKETASTTNRLAARNVQPVRTEAQRCAVTRDF